MTKDKAFSVKCAVSGALAGIINGFFGGGGGALLAPLFIKWVKLEDRRAFASCVMVILPLCIASAVIYLFKSTVDFAQTLPYLIGGAIGGTAAGKLFPKIPVKLLKRAFALFLIIGGAKALFGI